jgi:transcriptional regulator with XRE-family HTH domain
MSDHALMEHIGSFVRHHRMAQHRTQDDLAVAAGISRSTLSLLERGETVTLATLIQVLRVLDQLHTMDAFQVREYISPLALVRQQKAKRKRVRASSGKASQVNDDPEPTDW